MEPAESSAPKSPVGLGAGGFFDSAHLFAHPLFAAAAAAAHPSTSQDQFSMTHMPSAFSMFGAHPAFSSHLMGAEFGGLGSLRATASSLGASASVPGWPFEASAQLYNLANLGDYFNHISTETSTIMLSFFFFVAS
nr:uncharacterized protein LOC129257155 [Lytechinus pictus]